METSQHSNSRQEKQSGSADTVQISLPKVASDGTTVLLPEVKRSLRGDREKLERLDQMKEGLEDKKKGNLLGYFLPGLHEITGTNDAIKELNKDRGKLREVVDEAGDIEDDLILSVLRRATKAESFDWLSDGNFRSICKAFRSEYREIQTALEINLPELRQLPGFYTRLRGQLGVLPVEYFAGGISDLVANIEGNKYNEYGKTLAFRRLWPLEKEFSGGTLEVSRPVYVKALESGKPYEQVEAIKAMTTEPLLRPENFERQVERLVRSADEAVKTAALSCIESLGLNRVSIDCELSRLANVLLAAPQQIKEAAERMIKARIARGTYQPFSPVEASERILEGFVATPSLHQALRGVLLFYKNRIEGSPAAETNVRIALEGDAGIGKTLLATRIARGISADFDTLVKIDLAQVSSAEELTKRLSAAAPLFCKVVLFDEIQSLEAKSSEARLELIKALKPFFCPRNSPAGFELKDSIVVFTSNSMVEEMTSLDTEAGKPLKESIVSPSWYRISLQSDLRNEIEALVNGFAPFKYYEKEFSSLGEIELEESARNLMKSELRKLFPMEGNKRLSGREAVAHIAMAIVTAKALYEEAHDPLETDEKGKPIKRLRVSAGSNGDLVIVPCSTPATDTASALKPSSEPSDC